MEYYRQCTFVCNYSRTYNSTSNKNTSTKKIQCLFLINASCSKTNNPKSKVVVNKFLNEYNHTLNHNMIEFEDAKKFIYLSSKKYSSGFCKKNVNKLI
jgi:hypothetical protein